MRERSNLKLSLITALLVVLGTNAGCLFQRALAEGVKYSALELLLDSGAVIDLLPDGV